MNNEKEYNLYDIKECQKAIEEFEKFPTTVQIKSQHKSRIWALSDLCKKWAHINEYIFDPEYNNIYYVYYTAVIYHYNKHSNDQLEGCLKNTIIKLIQELNECIKIEYMTQIGELVEKTKGYWIEASTIK